MKTRRRVLPALGFAVLLALSGFLYYKTQAVNVEVQNQVVPDLRDLRQLDAEWNVNILKSRIGINTDYDAVTAPVRQIRKIEERLGSVLKTERGGSLYPGFERLQNAFLEKEDLVEQFKSQNAVLRNSLRYFPTAAEEFNALLAQVSSDMPNQAGALDTLQAKVNNLLTDILRFNLIPEAELGGRIDAVLKSIEPDMVRYPQRLSEPLQLLMKHARTILQQRVVEDALIVRIAGAPTVQDMDALAAAFDREFQDMLNDKQRYRTYLFAYSGFLLLLLAYAAWRVAHSYQLIAQGNRRLQAANETLEQRVAERTAALEKQSAQLVELASHDALTGLINRSLLMTRLNHALERAQRRGLSVALMFIDLDGFKAVNDTYGHAAGDLVLRQIALRTQRHIRQEDSLARFGGDEFVILVDEVGSEEGLVRIAEAVLQEIAGITMVDAHAVRISASLGIGVAQMSERLRVDARVAAELLLRQADHAMYKAKQCGKACFRFSDESAFKQPGAQ